LGVGCWYLILQAGRTLYAMRKFKELNVWKEGRKIAKQVYLVTELLPKSEQFGLTSQIRRCAISISSNIAEGSAKSSQKDFARYLEISLGSCFELESQLILCSDLGFLSEESSTEVQKSINNLQRQLNALLKYTLDIPKT
jgi:four helix bundle protein